MTQQLTATRIFKTTELEFLGTTNQLQEWLGYLIFYFKSLSRIERTRLKEINIKYGPSKESTKYVLSTLLIHNEKFNF